MSWELHQSLHALQAVDSWLAETDRALTAAFGAVGHDCNVPAARSAGNAPLETCSSSESQHQVNLL